MSKDTQNKNGGAPGQGPPPGSPLGSEPTVFFVGYPSPSKPSASSSRMFLNLEQTVYLDFSDADIIRHIVEDNNTGRARLFVRSNAILEVGYCFKGMTAGALFPYVYSSPSV